MFYFIKNDFSKVNYKGINAQSKRENSKTLKKLIEDLNKKIISISDDIIKAQNLSIEAIRELSDEMLLFNNELKENSKIRFTLENEIIKLKSIINRKNKEKKENKI